MAKKPITDSVEQQLVAAVSTDRLMADTAKIATWVRLSGSDEERQAFDYLETRCREIGAKIERHAPECYVSWPGPATFEALAPEKIAFNTITHSFAASTNGLEGELVYAGAGSVADLEKAGAKGKIALTDGLATPNKMVAAETVGVAGVVNICDHILHEMIVTPVWGTPTPNTAPMAPKTPAVSVVDVDGERLKKLCAAGPVRVKITAQVKTGWWALPCMTAEIPGDDPDGHFVMFSGHVDSWHYGAMDNGSANATMLEVMRGLAQRPGGLRRGLRLAFWSGHSHARYATSTWYADAKWRELHAKCVAHVNVDSTGGINASRLDDTHAMSESTALCSEAIQQIAGQELPHKRMSRSSDQSFWGVGLTALLGSVSHQEPSHNPAMEGIQQLLSGGAGRGGGLGWWWHTVEDTLDKIDPANLTRDTQVFTLVLNRLCTAAVIPFDYTKPAAEIQAAVKGYAEKAGAAVDFSEAIAACNTLVGALQRLNGAIAGAKDAATARKLNQAQLRIARQLVPINYASVAPHEHDLALPLPPTPTLRGANDLATLDPNSDAYKFRRAEVLRARNRVVEALDEAIAIAEAAVA